MLERASIEEDALERQRLLSFVIVGAGYAGVEIGAEANNLLHSALRFYPQVDRSELKVTIISNTDRILPAMTAKLAAKASAHLIRKGVTLRVNTSLSAATAGEVVLSTGERLQTRTIIATAGIGAHPIVQGLAVEKDHGRIKTDEFCRVPGWPGVYAAGDNAAVPHPKTGQPCPATFLYAITQAARISDNILAELRRRPLRRYRFNNIGEVAQLGSDYGLLQVGKVSFAGLLTSMVVRFVFFFAVPDWRCRVGLLADWFAAAVFPPDVTRMKIARTDMVVPLRFAAGQDIIRQGDPGNRFYTISSGKVEVVRRTSAGEQVVATLGPGQYFGEVALMQASGRTATVRAIEDTTVVSIARQDFTTLVEHLPILGEAFSQTTRKALADDSQRPQ
jgi:NADH dehydrogenase